MKFPKHVNPSSKRKATAPYNFVSLAQEIVPEIPRLDHDIYHSDRYTGIIHCTLETKTPLYTRAALEKGELSTYREQAKADFFYIDPATKQPVIPGSSLRGMLRTLLEIITFSKPQPVTDRQLYFRTLDTSLEIGKAYARRMVAGERNADGAYPNVQAGYMEKEGHNYYIRPAKITLGTQFFRVEEDLALQVIKANIGSAPLKNMSFKNERPLRRNPKKNETYWKPNNQYKWGRTPVWFKAVAPTSHKPTSAQYYADVTNVRLRRSGEATPGVGWVEGWFIASGWVPGPRSSRGKRLHWIIAPPDDIGKRCSVQDIDIDAYAELGAGRSQTIEKQKMSVLPQQVGDLIPCFYTNWKDSDGNERIAFGHTAMFRLPYEYSPRDLLPYPPQQLQMTDFAEAIFGWVDDKKGRTIAGRVSVRDAQVTAPSSTSLHLLRPNEPPLTPLLSGPKPTSFQHYLTQGSDQKADLYHYQDKGDTTLRGHKLYWHKSDKLQRQDYHDNAAPADSTQHTVMRPINKGVTFAFDLHFENLAAEELGALLWILRVAGDGKHCLKVGMAKPLGLGSVSVHARLCLSGRLARYRTLFSDLNWEEAPTRWEGNALAEIPTEQQFAKLNELLQNNETVEMADFVPFVRGFEEYMLAQLGLTNDKDAAAFARLPRIATLLALLQWPGPSQDQTQYMQGPNNQHMDNQFKDRPVLPDPLWITQPDLQQIGGNPLRNVRTPPVVVEPIPEVRVQVVAEVFRPPPQTLDELADKDLLQGTIVDVEQDSVLVNVGPGNLRLHIDQVWPPVRDQKMLKEKFPPDRVINVRVQRKRAGKVNLTMKPSHT